MVQAVQTPTSFPRDAGMKGRDEPFGFAQDKLREAIERLERLEL
jgi:hypothetical protein